VELGCNHVTGRDTGDFVIYQVRFRDGSSVDLGAARPTTGDWLQRLETIDARLRSAGATFKRWEWLGRDPVHPACLAEERAELGEDGYRRLSALLRVQP
jgi:hypothetical protein